MLQLQRNDDTLPYNKINKYFCMKTMTTFEKYTEYLYKNFVKKINRKIQDFYSLQFMVVAVVKISTWKSCLQYKNTTLTM